MIAWNKEKGEKIMKKKQRTFTLVELAAVAVAVLMLAAAAVPALHAAAESAHRASCADNMRKSAAALAGYSNDFDGWVLGRDAKQKRARLSTWGGMLQANKYIQTADLVCPDTPPSDMKAVERSNFTSTFGINQSAGDIRRIGGMVEDNGSRIFFRPADLIKAESLPERYRCKMALLGESVRALSKPNRDQVNSLFRSSATYKFNLVHDAQMNVASSDGSVVMLGKDGLMEFIPAGAKMYCVIDGTSEADYTRD